jgi:hypothetical protein
LKQSIGKIECLRGGLFLGVFMENGLETFMKFQRFLNKNHSLSLQVMPCEGDDFLYSPSPVTLSDGLEMLILFKEFLLKEEAVKLPSINKNRTSNG